MAESGSGRVGGLYVAVGVDVKKALTDVRKLRDELAKVQTSIDKLGIGNLGNLQKELKKAETAAAATSKKVAQAGAEAKKAAAAPVKDESAKILQQQINAAHAMALRENEARQRDARRMAEMAERDAKKAAEAQGREAKKAADAAAREAARVEQANKKAADAAARDAKRAADAQAKEAKRAADAAEREAKRAAAAQERAQRGRATVGSALFSGGQSILTGAGAVKTGNIFYGAAAASRYGKDLVSQFGALPGVMSKVAVGGFAVAAAVTAISVGAAAAVAKVVQFGIEGAASFQMLQIQLEGLLGSADRAKKEFSFLTELGKESIVPTESLIAADRQLLAFGITADGTRQSLVKFFSDFGTATGATEQQVYYLSLALGQVAAIGKANTIDLRQLANAGINLADLYDIIGKKYGKTRQEIAEGVSKGAITSEVLFAALTRLGTKYKKTAEDARLSTQGLIANIKDIFSTEFSKAFMGPNTEVASALERIQQLVLKIDFKRIGLAASNVFKSIKNALRGIDLDKILDWLNKYIPEAINVVGAYIGGLIRWWRTLIGVVNIVGQAIYQLFQNAIANIADFAYIGTDILDRLGIIADNEGERLRSQFKGMGDAARYESQNAVKEVEASFNDIKDIWTGTPLFLQLGVVVDTTSSGGYSGIPFTKGGASGLLEDITKPKLPEWPTQLGGADPSKKGGGAADQAATKMIDRYKKLISEAKQASESLGEALIVPFAETIRANGGQVISAAQEAFASGDIKQIVSQFTKVRDDIKKLFAPFENKEMAGSKKLANKAKAERKALIADLQSQTDTIVALAAQNEKITRDLEKLEKEYTAATEAVAKNRAAMEKQYSGQQAAIARKYDSYYTATSMTEGKFVKGAIDKAQEALDAATAAYEKAKEKLDALKEERDNFLKSVADSIRSYVNNLSVVQTEIEKYTRLDEAGSFSLTKSTDAADLASFKQGLNDRLNTLREWVANVKKVMASGLDSSLVQNLVQGGPEQTSGLAKALAGATAEDIAAINAVQAQLADQIKSVQDTASAKWFDAGISAQQAIVTPLEAAMQTAQATLDRLTAEKDLALGILEAWYTDQNAMYDAQQATLDANYETEKAKLQARYDENVAKAQAAAQKIQDSFSWLSDPKNKKNTYVQGVAAMQGFIDGMDSLEGKAAEKAKQIANKVASTIAKALEIRSPSRVMYRMGVNVTEGLALGMTDSISQVEGAAMSLSSAASGVSGAVGSMAAPEQGAPVVKVFIGDRELTDIVDVQIEQSSASSRDLVIAGRRY